MYPFLVHYSAVNCILTVLHCLYSSLVHSTVVACIFTVLHCSVLFFFSFLHSSLLHYSAVDCISTVLHCSVLLFSTLNCSGLYFYCFTLFCTLLNYTAQLYICIHRLCWCFITVAIIVVSDWQQSTGSCKRKVAAIEVQSSTVQFSAVNCCTMKCIAMP